MFRQCKETQVLLGPLALSVEKLVSCRLVLIHFKERLALNLGSSN